MSNTEISEHESLMIRNRKLNEQESESYYYKLNPVLNNLKLLLLVLKGMDNGRINKDYAAIYLYKFGLLISGIEVFKLTNSSKKIEPFFYKQVDELNKSLKELRELKWE